MDKYAYLQNYFILILVYLVKYVILRVGKLKIF